MITTVIILLISAALFVSGVASLTLLCIALCYRGLVCEAFDSAWLQVNHRRLPALLHGLFLALLVLLWLLMKPVELVVKLPLLRTVNAVGGGALGLVWGALLVFLAVWLLQRFDILLTPDMVEDSALLRFFATNSPLSLLTSLPWKAELPGSSTRSNHSSIITC